MRKTAAFVILALGVAATASADDLQILLGRAAEDLAATRKVTLKAVPPVRNVSQLKFVEDYILPLLNEEWGGDFDRSLDVFKALGLVPKDLDAKAFLRKYGACFTAAAYDYRAKSIFVPARDAARDTLVHELMHAAQDERFGIAKLMAPAKGNLDMTLAAGALLEGEALNVQLRFQMGYPRALAGVTPYGTLRDEARDYFESVNRNAVACIPDAPSAIVRAQAFVYEEGVLFVERLRRMEHNWAAVDAAYKMPPCSTTQILHPEKYLAGEWPVELTVANKENLVPGYRLVGENTLGEFGMRLFLASQEIRIVDSDKRVEGWRGDRVFLYRQEKGEAEVVLWVSTWEDGEKASKFASGLKSFESPFEPKQRRVSVGLKDNDVIGVISPAGGFDRLFGSRLIKKNSREGRPLGDQAEDSKGK